MAAPNLISATSIIGRTNAEWVSNASTAVLNNPVSSNQSLRINVLFLTNLTSNDVTVTVDLYRSSVSYKIFYDVPVSPRGPLVAIGKDTSIYLEEGDSLRIQASQPGMVQYCVSYEVMS